MIRVHAGNVTHAYQNYLARLATKKKKQKNKNTRYKNSQPTVTARWLPQQIASVNLLSTSLFGWKSVNYCSCAFTTKACGKKMMPAETRKNKTKRSEAKRNETKRNETKRNETKENKTNKGKSKINSRAL